MAVIGIVDTIIIERSHHIVRVVWIIRVIGINWVLVLQRGHHHHHTIAIVGLALLQGPCIFLRRLQVKMPGICLCLCREQRQLIAHAQVGHTVNHQSHLRHLIARREVLAHIAEAHITVHHQLVIACGILHFKTQHGCRMQN